MDTQAMNITAPMQNSKGGPRAMVSLEVVTAIADMVKSASQPVLVAEVWYRFCFVQNHNYTPKTIQAVLRHLERSGVLESRVESLAERALRFGQYRQAGTGAYLFWARANGPMPVRSSLTVLPDTNIVDASLSYRRLIREMNSGARRPAKRIAAVQTGRGRKTTRPATDAAVQTGTNRIERLERRITSLESTILELAKLLR